MKRLFLLLTLLTLVAGNSFAQCVGEVSKVNEEPQIIIDPVQGTLQAQVEFSFPVDTEASIQCIKTVDDNKDGTPDRCVFYQGKMQFDESSTVQEDTAFIQEQLQVHCGTLLSNIRVNHDFVKSEIQKREAELVSPKLEDLKNAVKNIKVTVESRDVDYKGKRITIHEDTTKNSTSNILP